MTECVQRHLEQASAGDGDDGGEPGPAVVSPGGPGPAPRGDLLPFPACSAKVFMQLCAVAEQGLWDSVAVVRLRSAGPFGLQAVGLVCVREPAVPLPHPQCAPRPPPPRTLLLAPRQTRLVTLNVCATPSVPFRIIPASHSL